MDYFVLSVLIGREVSIINENRGLCLANGNEIELSIVQIFREKSLVFKKHLSHPLEDLNKGGGMILFQIKNNGDVKTIELKPNGKSVDKKDC